MALLKMHSKLWGRVVVYSEKMMPMGRVVCSVMSRGRERGGMGVKRGWINSAVEYITLHFVLLELLKKKVNRFFIVAQVECIKAFTCFLCYHQNRALDLNIKLLIQIFLK